MCVLCGSTYFPAADTQKELHDIRLLLLLKLLDVLEGTHLGCVKSQQFGLPAKGSSNSSRLRDVPVVEDCPALVVSREGGWWWNEEERRAVRKIWPGFAAVECKMRWVCGRGGTLVPKVARVAGQP